MRLLKLVLLISDVNDCRSGNIVMYAIFSLVL